MPQNNLAPLITPHGHLRLAPMPDAPALAETTQLRLAQAFARGAGHGLLQLGAGETGVVLPPALAWWREFASGYMAALCALPETENGKPGRIDTPVRNKLETLIADAPPMDGAEYLTVTVLRNLWAALDAALHEDLAAAACPLKEFLHRRCPAWNLVGRVHFNLAENRADDEAPFAFLATYTTRLSAHGKAQHLPLAQALREYAGAKNKAQLLALLSPVQRAAEQSPWVKTLVDAGDIYHPLRWTAGEALRLLNDVPRIEAAGVVVRVPGAWRTGRPSRPVVQATVGAKPPSLLGASALLDFDVEVTLDGERLSATDIRKLLAGTEGLQLIRGRWIEVDHQKLGRLIERFEGIGKAAADGLSFVEAMRLLAGVDGATDGATAPDDLDWSSVVAGPWLANTLQSLRSPDGLARVDPGKDLAATLRPYQQAGVRWLYLLHKLGLGACLADDMGLGKTMQVLALLLVLRRESTGSGQRPSLLVAPASLLANWAAEIERYAPQLTAVIAHPSIIPAGELKTLDPKTFTTTDLVITNYGTLLRLPWIGNMRWRIAILDEAQAIKNPGAKQTRAAKTLNAVSRIALTGTPVENRLSDLWSIFDYINPGLLGSGKAFSTFTRRLESSGHFGPLRELTRPYILRRLKTDKSVISDLPDKTEIKAYCGLSARQAALYQDTARELAAQLNDAEGIARKGLVLAFLMRFKQILNHPSQWLGDGAWHEADSGKFQRLREIAEVIAAKQEKVLVFTQFRETTAPLADYLGSIFGRPGLVLHGETSVGKRRQLVRRFQEDESIPFFVLSIKAGGAGLNLTAASHVVHFDRWWNPAVEDQATDRAFRIGQTKNVLVHKFVCRGTLEDKIDTLIESKRKLVQDLIEDSAGPLLTEMSDSELMKLVTLDIHATREET